MDSPLKQGPKRTILLEGTSSPRRVVKRFHSPGAVDGIKDGLRAWREALEPGGWVAFSHPVHLSDSPSAAARAFWQGEGEIGTVEDLRARVAGAGYALRGERMLVGAPWKAYYDALRAAISEARATGRAAALAPAIEGAETEIARWEAAARQRAAAE